MLKFRPKTFRSIRPMVTWALAALTAMLSLGNSSGLVLCIEDDGTVSIESPAEQAECHHRHKQAADQSARYGDQVEVAETCIDIPLCVAAQAVTQRPTSSRGQSIEVGSLPVPVVALCEHSVAESSHWVCDAPPAPQPALAALRTVVLLV